MADDKYKTHANVVAFESESDGSTQISGKSKVPWWFYIWVWISSINCVEGLLTGIGLRTRPQP